ncbi:MAG: flavodoxin [Methanoregulaceae archaeon]|jgi:flavodoxin
MARCIIYYSYSGTTRRLAKKVKAACGADSIEVTSNKTYNALTVYPLGSYRASKGEKDPIEPKKIDVTRYDLIILGTPVWAWKPTPAMNAAIAALKGCEGKKAIIFATCGGQPGKTIDIMKKQLESQGVKVIGDFIFNRKDVRDGKKINELIVSVNATITE